MDWHSVGESEGRILGPLAHVGQSDTADLLVPNRQLCMKRGPVWHNSIPQKPTTGTQQRMIDQSSDDNVYEKRKHGWGRRRRHRHAGMTKKREVMNMDLPQVFLMVETGLIDVMVRWSEAIHLITASPSLED